LETQKGTVRQLITTRILRKHCGHYIVLFAQGEAQNTHFGEVIGLCSRRSHRSSLLSGNKRALDVWKE